MKIAKIINNDLANGPGLRTSIFVSGCETHCKNCHNPHLWNFDVGIEYEKVIDEIYSNLTANGIQRNLSILGGEPLNEQNFPEVLKLCQELKKRMPNLKIWIWTGFFIDHFDYDENFDRLRDFVDVIVDGPYDETQKNGVHPWRGSANQSIWEIK